MNRLVETLEFHGANPDAVEGTLAWALAQAQVAVRGLDEVRQALRDKATAESQLARLRGYARLTPGMKDDQRRWCASLSAAEATLRRVLGGAS